MRARCLSDDLPAVPLGAAPAE
ncbi:hypothetical protein [Acetobacter musti]